MQNLFKNTYFVGALIGLIVGIVAIAILMQSGVVVTPGADNNGSEVNQPDSAVNELDANDTNSSPIAPGASSVTEEGVVLNTTGEEADNSAVAGSPEAPQQSRPLEESEVPDEAIKIGVTRDGGFAPSKFTVKSGATVTLSITSNDTFTYVFKFENSTLSGVAVGVGPGETRAITFNAPVKGEYVFFSDVPGHRDAGLVGTMTVN